MSYGRLHASEKRRLWARCTEVHHTCYNVGGYISLWETLSTQKLYIVRLYLTEVSARRCLQLGVDTPEASIQSTVTSESRRRMEARRICYSATGRGPVTGSNDEVRLPLFIGTVRQRLYLKTVQDVYGIQTVFYAAYCGVLSICPLSRSLVTYARYGWIHQ